MDIINEKNVIHLQALEVIHELIIFKKQISCYPEVDLTFCLTVPGIAASRFLRSVKVRVGRQPS